MSNEAKTSHIIALLKDFLEGKAMTSSDYFIVNANQYFVTIKKNGVELIEVWENNRFNSGKHKVRRLNPSLENIRRAEKYLDKLLGKKADEKAENSL